MHDNKSCHNIVLTRYYVVLFLDDRLCVGLYIRKICNGGMNRAEVLNCRMCSKGTILPKNRNEHILYNHNNIIIIQMATNYSITISIMCRGEQRVCRPDSISLFVFVGTLSLYDKFFRKSKRNSDNNWIVAGTRHTISKMYSPFDDEPLVKRTY